MNETVPVPNQIPPQQPVVQQQPQSSMPPPNLSTPPTNNSHLTEIILISLAVLFVLGAGTWLLLGSKSPKTKFTIGKNPTPTVTTTLISPTPTVPAVPTPSAQELQHVSEELRSGDTARILTVLDYNGKELSPAFISSFGKIKQLTFDVKTFQVAPDGKTATVKATMTLSSGPTQTMYHFIRKNGKWLISTTN